MRNKGQFVKGEHSHPQTEFKPGTHWRKPKPHWDAEWLRREYVEKGRSCSEIAEEMGCGEANIQYWLEKHGVPRRSMSQIRAIKHWGAEGPANPMYGRRGEQVPNWKGGVTPERNAFYSRAEWKALVKTVNERSGELCERCGAVTTGRRNRYYHHIVSFRVKELRADPGNVVLLCGCCHKFVHSKDNTAGEYLRKEVA